MATANRRAVPKGRADEPKRCWKKGVPKGLVLLTGATGFVGRQLYGVLRREGYEVRCASRQPEAARRRWPERDWVYMDLECPQSIAGALEGCRGAYYLVHGLGTGSDFPERETRAALAFVEAADQSGLERLVYLGGIAPQGLASRHLHSRLVTGAILRSARACAVELRASMIVGATSASWRVVRDLAVRLPAMILPSWLGSRTQPVALVDVQLALVAAMRLDLPRGQWWDIPGPETLSFEECLMRTAAMIGSAPPAWHVPLLSLKLSSYWIRLLSGEDYAVVRELVEGLRSDILSQGPAFWPMFGHEDLTDFDTAVRRAWNAQLRQRTRAEKAVGLLYRPPATQGLSAGPW